MNQAPEKSQRATGRGATERWSRNASMAKSIGIQARIRFQYRKPNRKRPCKRYCEQFITPQPADAAPNAHSTRMR